MTIALSPASEFSDTSHVEVDSAIEQLFAEASPRRERSIKFADYLNSARVPRVSSRTFAANTPAVGMARNHASQRKLKHPTFHGSSMATQSRQNAGRRDPYQVPESPEKQAHYQPPETRSPNSPKKGKKRKIADVDAEQLTAPPSSPPYASQDQEDESVSGRNVSSNAAKRRSSRLASGDVDSPSKDWKQKARNDTNAPSRPRGKAAVVSAVANPRMTCSRRQLAEVRIPAKPKSAKVESELQLQELLNGEDSQQLSASERGRFKKQEGPRQKPMRLEKSAADPPVNSMKDSPAGQVTGNEAVKDVHGPLQADEPSKELRSDDAEDGSSEGSEADAHTNDSDDADMSAYADAHTTLVNDAQDVPSELDRITSFIEKSARRGRCQTQYGSEIRKICREARKSICDQADEQSLEEVRKSLDRVVSSLRTIPDLVVEEDSKAFKIDVYTYLFRSLACCFRTAHQWTTSLSLPVLKALVPFMEAILSTNDMIKSWKVSLPQQSKGVRIVLDTSQGFITPLRKLRESYRDKMRLLERSEQDSKIRKESLARWQQTQEREERRAKAAKILVNRKKRWQHLHFLRLMCEPSLDQRRRRHLAYIPFEDVEEVDANGVRFEREPIFCDRKAPFVGRAAGADKEKWGDEQDIALLEGLQKHTGKPLVFLPLQPHN
jgi:hypothetical protein